MKRVHKLSCDCFKSEIDLMSIPSTQSVIEKSRWVDYYPIASLSDGGPIEFLIPGSGQSYLDLATNQLLLKVQITKPNGTPIDADTKVGPVNLLLHSLFSNLSVSWNEKLVSSASGNYPYRAYIENLLTYGTDAKNSQKTSALYYRDTPGKMDVHDPSAADGNAGLAKRYTFTNGGKIVDLLGRLHASVFMQDRLLINGVDVKVKLTRAKSDFTLMSSVTDAAFKVKIIDAVWRVRKVQVSSSLMLEHARALAHNNNVSYPISRVECRIFSIPRGNHALTHENLFLNQIPKRLVLGFVESAAYHGSYSKNPYNFLHCNLNYLEVSVDGESVPTKPLQPNYDTNGGQQYITAYNTLFSGTGKMYKDEGIDISREDYPLGYCLYAVDLTPDISAGEDHFNLIRQGSVSVKAQFASPLQETTNLVVYAEFQNIIEIDQQRNVLYDYSL